MKTIYTILFLTLFTSLHAQQFYIGPGAEVNVDNGSTLYTAFDLQNQGKLSFDSTGDLYVDGGFDNISGVLTLNDAVFHMGSGSPASASNDPYTFNTGGDLVKFVELNKSGGTATVDAVNGGNLNISNTITSNGMGTLNASGKIVLISSTVNETAIVPTSTGGDINNIVVERFMPQKDAYRFLTSSVTTTGTIFDNWQQGGLNPSDPGYKAGYGMHITGPSATLGFDLNTSLSPSMYSWDATSQVWEPIPNTNVLSLVNSTAYLAIVRGDRSISIIGNDPNSNNVSTTLSSVGELVIGDKTITESRLVNEFMAFGNPYQAPVSMQNIIGGINSNNITDSYSVWDPNIGGFGSYVTFTDQVGINVPGSQQSINLQPGQATFVQATTIGTTSVTFTEADKASLTGLTEVFKGSDEKTNLDGFIRIGLYTPGSKPFTDAGKDGVVIRFDDKFSENSEKYNHGKLFGFGENLYISANDRALTVNSRPLPSQLDEVINLGLNFEEFKNNAQYKFSVELEGLTSLPNGIMLWDKYTDSYTTLEDIQIINFELDSSIPGSIIDDRFVLVFQNKSLSIEDQTISEISIYPNPVTSNFLDIQFSQASNSDTTIEIFDLLGKKVMSREFEDVQNSLRLENLTFSTGVYLLNVKQNDQTRTFKIIKE